MQKVQLSSRLKAMGWHMLFSLCLLMCSIYLVFFIWYPAPLAQALGTVTVFSLLLVIDLMLGPLLSFIFFKHNRIKWTIDLAVILVLQLSAFFYGLFIIYEGRPAWLVFVVDDIEVVSPVDLKQQATEVVPAEFKAALWQGPQWVAAVYSQNPAIARQQKDDELFKGISMAVRPETYQQLSARSNEVQHRLLPLQKLEQFNTPQAVNQIKQKYLSAAGWLPLKAPEQDMVAIFDKSGRPVAVINLRPWD